MATASRPAAAANAGVLSVERHGRCSQQASLRSGRRRGVLGCELITAAKVTSRQSSGKRQPRIAAKATDSEQAVSSSDIEVDDIFVERRLAPSLETFGPLSRPFFGAPLAFRAGAISATVCAALAVLKICSHIVESLEAVPLLPQVELLVGTMVTAKFAFDYVGGGEGRARIESFFEGFMDRLQGIRGFEEASDPEPSMLDVQLRSVVDEYVKMHQATDGDGVANVVPVLSNKQSLVDALKSFVLVRELKARRINSVLRRDVENLTQKTARIEAIEEVGQRQAASLEAAADEKAYLTTLCQVLKEEKDNLGVTVSSLTAQVAHMSNQLEALFAAREDLRQQNKELGANLEQAIAANGNLSGRLTSLEDKATDVVMKMKASEDRHAATLAMKESEMLQLQKDFQLVQESLAGRLQVATEALEKETTKHETDVRDAKDRLQSLEVAREQHVAAIAALEASLALAQRKRPSPNSKAKNKTTSEVTGRASLDAAITAVPGKLGLEIRTFELTVYARSVRDQFVDVTKPWKEQEDGVASLVKALVARGASEEWAVPYVRRSMAYAYSRQSAEANGNGGGAHTT